MRGFNSTTKQAKDLDDQLSPLTPTASAGIKRKSDKSQPLPADKRTRSDGAAEEPNRGDDEEDLSDGKRIQDSNEHMVEELSEEPSEESRESSEEPREESPEESDLEEATCADRPRRILTLCCALLWIVIEDSFVQERCGIASDIIKSIWFLRLLSLLFFPSIPKLYL
jgi:hypothetical protein